MVKRIIVRFLKRILGYFILGSFVPMVCAIMLLNSVYTFGQLYLIGWAEEFFAILIVLLFVGLCWLVQFLFD